MYFMIKIIFLTMSVSFLIFAISCYLLIKDKKTITFEDIDKNFGLIIVYYTSLYLLLMAGICGFFFWPICYGIEFIFKILF